MAWSFADSFDLYAATADMVTGYWDSGSTIAMSLQAGRFSGSQAIQIGTATGALLTKSSAVNDAVHHIVCAFRQTAPITGTTLVTYFQLLDGTTGQCCIVFRSDGAILLTSGTAAGTVLATYTGAVTAQNTWFAFEFEISISNTVGVFNARKNGNPSNDFSASSLNTRGGTANNYANKLTIGVQAGLTAHQIDDLFWQSGAVTGNWLGDIRCYARMPVSDVQKQFTPLSGTTNYTQVSEAHQDGLTTYVYDSNPGDADFYGIASIASTPATVIATTLRGYMQKSDAGTRTAAMQMKSGATTVASPTLNLSTTFLWAWRTDVTDPNTGAAWTPVAVNNVQIGPVTIV